MISLSIVLPAYLEEENLRILLPRLNSVRAGLATSGVSSEILILDTVTPLDKTQDACQVNGATYVPREGGNRFGDAVRTGISRAQGEFILFMDADGSHTPEFIPELWKKTPQADVVIASRYVEGGYTENTFSLVLMSRILNWTYAFVLGLKCKDVSNSFKIYRAVQLKPLVLKCHNFDIVEEILYKLSRKHPQLRIVEIPFSFKKRMFGDTKRNLFLFIITYLVTIIKLRLNSD